MLAEVDMEFYHSLPPVQEILGEMTRLEILATSHKESNITTATTTTITTLTLTPTTDQRQPKNDTSTTTTSTTATLTPTADRLQPKSCTEKNTRLDASDTTSATTTTTSTTKIPTLTPTADCKCRWYKGICTYQLIIKTGTKNHCNMVDQEYN